MDGFPYRIGRSKIEMTPEAKNQVLMGWGDPLHRARRVAAPLHVRAIRVQDDRENVIFFVQLDLCMVSEYLHSKILSYVRESKIPELASLQDSELVLAANHTHAAPGGYCREIVYQVGSLGMDEEWVQRIAERTRTALEQSCEESVPANLVRLTGTIPENSRIQHNRSLEAYLHNPDRPDDRGVDPEFPILHFVGDSQESLAVMSFLGLHGTCIHQDQNVIHPDHKGLASQSMEATALSDRFVALFLQGAAGDQTSNFQSHTPNDFHRGVSPNDFENAKYVAEVQVEAIGRAIHLQTGVEEIRGVIQSVRTRVDFFPPGSEQGPSIGLPMVFSTQEGLAPSRWLTQTLGWLQGRQQQGQTPQGLLHAGKNRALDGFERRIFCFSLDGVAQFSRTFFWLHPVLKRLRELSMRGELDQLPLLPEYQSISVLRIGQQAIVAAPGEFTLQASRRLLGELGEARTIFLGYANGYGSYVTTPEEYDLQRYEGASTLYGRGTLSTYQAALREILRRTFRFDDATVEWTKQA